MEEIVLQAELREVKGKQVKALRRQGRLPAVIYGRRVDPISISLDMHNSSRVLPRVTSSHLVVVDIHGERHTTLVRERQRNPLTGSLVHIDFQEVSLTEKLRTNVMIEFVGESSAVKNFNAVVVTGQERLEVECLPGDLVERITVDLSILKNIGDSIVVRDIKLPPEIEVLTDLSEMIALVTLPAQEAEPEAAVVTTAEGEPEVIERGKKEDEDF